MKNYSTKNIFSWRDVTLRYSAKHNVIKTTNVHKAIAWHRRHLSVENWEIIVIFGSDCVDTGKCL